ncbi:MAG TPA: hypothetical protein VJS44_13120 [Pyrinomonadaceae bacterium]|nr:hypothetical protein [Pyrinomonadaceae bacterium]
MTFGRTGAATLLFYAAGDSFSSLDVLCDSRFQRGAWKRPAVKPHPPPALEFGMLRRVLSTLYSSQAMLTGAHGTPTRAHSMPTRAHSMLTGAHGMLRPAHALPSRGHGMLMGAHGMPSPAHGMRPRGHGLLSEGFPPLSTGPG